MRSLSTVCSLLWFGFLMACDGSDDGSSNDGPTVDCRIEGYGCTGDFSCQLNVDDEYECLPINQGGAAGDGDSDGGLAGQGDDSGNDAASEGEGGDSGNESGNAG